MTLAEFADYCLTISAQTAAEPAASPILDADMAIEVFLPAVLREVTREAFRSNTYLHTLVKAHGIEINRGFGVLPPGLEEQFVESFQVARIRPVFSRSILAPVTKGAVSDRVVAGAGKSGFQALLDTGLIIAIELDDDEVVRARIEEVIDAENVDVRDYEIGSNAEAASNVLSIGKIYEPQYVLDRTLAAHKEAPGNEVVADEADVLLATEDDIGKLLVIEVGGVIVIRAIITAVPDENSFTIAGYSATIVAEDAGTANIYALAEASEILEGYFTPENVGLFSHYPQYADYVREIDDILPRFCVRDNKIFVKDADDLDFDDGTGIVVYGVAVPQIPATESEEIPVGEQFLDDALIVAAAVLRGDRSLESIGLSTEKLKAKR